MKTSLFYGLGIAIAGAVIALLEFFFGFHNDPAKFELGQKIGFISLPITLVLLFLGLRARRDEVPATEGFGYGRAVGTGTMIGLFSGLFGAVFYLLYGFVINPEFHDLLYQFQMDAVAAKGGPTPPEGMMRFFTGPVWTAVMVFVGSIFICLVGSLIIAIFVKRPASEPPVIA